MEEETQHEKSSYNEASFQIMRLNDGWRRCKDFKTSGQFERWTLELDSIWAELTTDAKKLEGIEKQNNKYYKKIAFYNKIIFLYLKSRKTDQAYYFIGMKEDLLRDLQDESGKGGKYQSLSESEFE